jgi:hypothetical protein
LGPHLLLQQEINSSLPKQHKKRREAASELEHYNNRENLADNTNALKEESP